MGKKIFIKIVSGIMDFNYYIFLFIAIAATILYIFNFKKAGKWVPLSIGLYILSQAIGEALL